MATTRIKDLTTASAMADDDFIAIDGATNGTRKIAASDVGGNETIYEKQFATYYNGNFSAAGGNYIYYITPTNTSDVTQENAMKISAFYRTEDSTQAVCPLIVTECSVSSSTRMTVYVKSIYALNYSTTTIQYLPAGYVYFRAPFEIASITAGM